MSRKSLISLCKKDLVDIYSYAIEAVKPENLIKNAINLTDNQLTIRGCSGVDDDSVIHNITLEQSSLHLIGGGKSVMSMARGLAQLAREAGVNQRFSCGHLSLPSGLESTFTNSRLVCDDFNSIGVKCLFGSRDNLPDEKSVQASGAILRGVEEACERDRENSLLPLFIVLISGGGSACLTRPKHVSLHEKLELIKFLVQKGANIVELNKVRRYFSAIKAGGLARHILKSHPNARIVTLILSDVIGDTIEYIASGPTHLTPTTTPDSSTRSLKQGMLSILEKYGYSGHLLSRLLLVDNNQEPIEPAWDKDRVLEVVIGNNKIAIDAAMRRARHLGYQIQNISNQLEGSSQIVVDQLITAGEQTYLSPNESAGGVLVIGGGEVTINRLDNESWGKGGRAQEMAIDYMIARLSTMSKLNNGQETAYAHAIDVFLAGGTDGQDGPTDVAACLASLADFKLNDDALDLAKLLEAKRGHDSYNFWTNYKPDWLVKTGLTGTNVMDLYMYLLRND